MNERTAEVTRAIADIAAGRPVVVVEGERGQGEGNLVIAADAATRELLAFVVRWTSGFICVALSTADCDRLKLPPMCGVGPDRNGSAYTVTVDARAGVTTGISGVDRARTITLLADPDATPGDLARPGHVLPMRVDDRGVLGTAATPEAAVDLARLAGRPPAGALCGIVSSENPIAMARGDELRTFAEQHGLCLISVEDLITYRTRTEQNVRRVVESRMPLRHGDFRGIGYQDLVDGTEHIALVHGNIGDGQDMLVAVHAECVIGDALGSLRCDCGPRLDAALARVAEDGRGAVLYMRGPDRDAGVLQELRALQLRDGGADVFAGLAHDMPAAERVYSAAAQILSELGIRSARLLTDNPVERGALDRNGCTVTECVSLLTAPRYSAPMLRAAAGN
jgi:3,4-dihydroxy 2-butanone 4-phosphate synthase/GTP cyclohydrolase II